MKTNITNALRTWSGLALVLVVLAVSAMAQQPTPSPKKADAPEAENSTPPGEEAGDYIIVSSIEFGYRGLSFSGDINKYQSDLNYKAGPRLFDSSFYMKSKNGKGGLFDSLLITSTGWGADPQSTVRLSVEKPAWYRFDANYRRFKYFRFLNSFANPNWVFSPATFSVPPKRNTGEHGTDTRMQLGDFDLTLFPTNERFRFTIGYSPERYNGPAFTNWHYGGNEFNFLSQVETRANDFRFGADGKIGPIDLTFLQGFRRFRDDSFINQGVTPGINLNPTAARLNSFSHTEPTRGSVNFTRFSLHSLIANKLDITARVIYSKATSDSVLAETFTGANWNPRITGWPPGPLPTTPNILNLGRYIVSSNAERPNWLGDLGITYFATDKLRISNSFKVEDFEITGRAVFSNFFSITRGAGATLRTDTIAFNNLDANRVTTYRKYQNTIEADYQFNDRYSVHVGYRFGRRRIGEFFEGFNLGSNGSVTTPPARTLSAVTEENNTNAIIAGFKLRPFDPFTVYFDMERGTADNVFTRIGNYNYTNIRAKTRYQPSRKLGFNVSLVVKNNSNPSEIAGVSLQEFGVDVKSRLFNSTVDWAPNSKVSFSTGYTYNWVTSDSIVDYFFNSVRHPLGESLNFIRNHYFFADSMIEFHPRVMLYTSYRINKDTGQGDRLADPTGVPGVLIASYPMSFQSPEARMTFKLNRWLDWNVGYQYYNYNESPLVGPRPQNYHAHQPYGSLRIFFGRKE